jgi:hypothetical protein
MNSLVFATSLLMGHVTVESKLDARNDAEPAISIVNELLLDVSEQIVTTGEPMDSESRGPCDDDDEPSSARPSSLRAARAEGPHPLERLTPL